jgi:hypothetical protein
MCRTAGETHAGFRPDDPTGPVHTGYRQYSIAKILTLSIIGFFVGTLAAIAYGIFTREQALNNVTQGIWERVDSEQGYACKFSEKSQQIDDYILGISAFATKYTYMLVCDTEFATQENGYSDCLIDNNANYGCPESQVQWYSYFINATLTGALNQFVDLSSNPVICCIDRCPDWTQEWYCAPEHYNDGGICDCECGYPDPDCAPEVTITGFRGCCHEDYEGFGVAHLIGCLNGSSPGEFYQQKCYTDLRCDDNVYNPPNADPFPCGFEQVHNPVTMPLEVYGLRSAEMWIYTSPLSGLFVYILCILCFPCYALACGLNCRPKRILAAGEPPPRELNLKPYTGGDDVGM